MLIAVDEVEALKSISQNWPILAMLIAAIGTFYRGIAQPLAARHVQYLDQAEVQLRANTENGIRQTAILESLLGETKEHSDKLSQIRQLVTAAKCNVEPACSHIVGKK